MSEINIPPEAVEEALKAFGCECNSCRKAVMRVLQAGLRAWPGMDAIMLPRMVKPGQFVAQNYIRLPLPQEKQDG